MNVQFRVDDSEFQKTLRQYLTVTSRTLPQALNEKMFYIVRGAVRGLPKVPKSTIEQELKVVGYQLQYIKSGKRLRKASQQGRASSAILGGPLIYKILNARRTFAGKPGLKRGEMKEKAAKFLAARLRSVGTLKAGWWGALKALGIAVNQTNNLKDSQLGRITNPSTAKVAHEGWNPSVEVEYNLNAKDPHYQRSIDDRVTGSFRKSWGEELVSMKDRIEGRIAGELKKIDPAGVTSPIVLQPPIRTEGGWR